jgi:hypothetical protein
MISKCKQTGASITKGQNKIEKNDLLDVSNHGHRTDIVLEVHNGPHLFDGKVHLEDYKAKKVRLVGIFRKKVDEKAETVSCECQSLRRGKTLQSES